MNASQYKLEAQEKNASRKLNEDQSMIASHPRNEAQGRNAYFKSDREVA
jgi:hypothetical protein